MVTCCALMMRTLLLTAILLIYVTDLVAQSPGGVSGNLRLWLKANTNALEENGTTAEEGETVEVWDDNSPDDNDAVNGTTTRRPIFRTNIINGNPALEFNATKYLDTETVSGIGPTESFTIFLVFKQNSFVGGGNDATGTFIIDRPTATNNLTTFKIINTDKYFYQRRDNSGNNLSGPISVTPANTSSFVIANFYRNTTTTREGIYLDGRQDIDQAGIGGNITGPVVRIGNHATNVDDGGLNGYFAEMIAYNTDLSTGNRQRVETYLAVKYGITLNSSMDYIRRDGTIIYPSTGSHSGFVSDIAGIGRDDANSANSSALLQSASQSQNANSVVRIFNASSLSNNDFLVWGSNNGSLTVPSTSDLPAGILRKLSRIWRVAETGNVGSISISVDLSAVPGSKTAADLRLLVDANGIFAPDATQYTVSSSSGSVFTFDNVAIADDYYFTIGTVNASSTPLPIELSDFRVSYENPVVTSSWQTASELNNDYFTLERAGNDLVFEEIGREPGAGTSQIPHSYSMIDLYPYDGVSYYRLKQTDIDGTSTYSDTKYMFIEETKKQLALFPNPNPGKQIEVAFGNTKFNLNHIAVINQQGRIIETSYINRKDLKQYSVELKQKLPPGLYMVRVHYNGKDEFVKLMVQ